MSAFRRIDLDPHIESGWKCFSFSKCRKWEVLDREREIFYAYSQNLSGEGGQIALDYLKLFE